jgi:hypothetical protein
LGMHFSSNNVCKLELPTTPHWKLHPSGLSLNVIPF